VFDASPSLLLPASNESVLLLDYAFRFMKQSLPVGGGGRGTRGRGGGGAGRQPAVQEPEEPPAWMVGWQPPAWHPGCTVLRDTLFCSLLGVPLKLALLTCRAGAYSAPICRLLLQHLLSTVPSYSQSVLQALQRYPWPAESSELKQQVLAEAASDLAFRLFPVVRTLAARWQHQLTAGQLWAGLGHLASLAAYLQQHWDLPSRLLAGGGQRQAAAALRCIDGCMSDQRSASAAQPVPRRPSKVSLPAARALPCPNVSLQSCAVHAALPPALPPCCRHTRCACLPGGAVCCPQRASLSRNASPSWPQPRHLRLHGSHGGGGRGRHWPGEWEWRSGVISSRALIWNKHGSLGKPGVPCSCIPQAMHTSAACCLACPSSDSGKSDSGWLGLAVDTSDRLLHSPPQVAGTA